MSEVQSSLYYTEKLSLEMVISGNKFIWAISPRSTLLSQIAGLIFGGILTKDYQLHVWRERLSLGETAAWCGAWYLLQVVAPLFVYTEMVKPNSTSRFYHSILCRLCLLLLSNLLFICKAMRHFILRRQLKHSTFEILLTMGQNGKNRKPRSTFKIDLNMSVSNVFNCQKFNASMW